MRKTRYAGCWLSGCRHFALRLVLIISLGSPGVWQATARHAQSQSVFVSSRGTHSVKRYDGTTGVFQGDFVPSSTGGLNTTQEVVFGPDGHLYVSGRFTNAILKFDGQTGAFLGPFTSGYVLDEPTKFTFGPDSLLYVSQWGQQKSAVVRFDAETGAFVDEFTPDLNQGMDHAWDAAGTLYVVSFGSRDVRRFDAQGNLIDVFIGPAILPGPVNLWFGEGGDLFVMDWQTGVVKRFDGETGAFKANFITGLTRAEGFTIGPDGLLYICDWQQNRINRYDPDTGAFIDTFISGSGLIQPNSLVFGPAMPPAGPVFTRVTTGAAATDAANSQGASWIDYDGDRDLDLFVANVGTQANFLYRNEGDGTLLRVTTGDIATDRISNKGNCWADVDNDGDLDVFVTGSAPAFYQNDGAGRLSRLNNNTVFGTNDLRGWACAWADYDLDSFVDLIITHPAGSFGTPALPNFLFHNEGNGAFTRITDTPITMGLAPYTVPSWSDYDLDGDPDLFIGSGPATATPGPDFLYRNMLTETGTATFERITEGPLASATRDGQIINWIDYDIDGDLDAFITNWGGGLGGRADELYRNDEGRLTKITTGSLVTDRAVSLASVWGDFDNDGDQDVFITDGNANQTNRFYENNGDGTFTRLTAAPFSTDRSVSWGASAGDYDNDGDLDLFVANALNGSQNFLYRNDLGAGHHWLKIHLVGTASNRAAIGARVRVKATLGGQAVWQLREVSSQNSFNGHNSLVVHVGLAEATVVDSLRIEWPSGQVDVHTEVAVDQFLVVTEGQTASPVAADDAPVLPDVFVLSQTYPNPFTEATTIAYQLSARSPVTITVYDLLGRRVRTLVDEHQGPGARVVVWDGRHEAGGVVSPGVYLVRLQTAGGSASRRIVRVR